MNIESLIIDLAPFADLGAEPPHAVATDTGILVRLSRLGSEVDLLFREEHIIERSDDGERKHRNLKALLASPKFSNMGQWADSQKLILKNRIQSETLPLSGHSDQEVGGIEIVDRILKSGIDGKNRNIVLVVDGPAGIGKTSFIRRISYERAINYRVQQLPLILHVESRGRVLQNITDLMAFSLQTLRVPVTYDQVPALVRNGLITLAIDGFDELGDPNGYELAWAQLNELIESARGNGSFILSGRETFISSSRIRKALPSIDDKLDSLFSYTIDPVLPHVAQEWLRSKGWNDETLNSEQSKPIFEHGSYALRPFFLTQLGEMGSDGNISLANLNGILPFLINSMTVRESGKFGKDVENVTSQSQREEFIALLMEEVARDLAENQTDALAGDTLVWLSDVVSNNIPTEVQGIIRNRVQVMAFITNDIRPGYRRFIHEQVQNYYLAQVTIRSVSKGELPKYLRRNILGLDFLENFSEVVRSETQEKITLFVKSCTNLLEKISDQDRAKRNLASLVMVCCSIFSIEPKVEIKDVSLDEALLVETVTNLKLIRSTIAQLDARGADFSGVEFEECHLVTMLSDEGTVPSQSIPVPSILELPGETVVREQVIDYWLGRQYISVYGNGKKFPLREALENFPLIRLLARYTRYRPYWLKDTDERSARKILDDENWEQLKEILKKYNLLVERFDVPAAGRPAPFYHLKNREALRNLDSPPDWAVDMLHELIIKSPEC